MRRTHLLASYIEAELNACILTRNRLTEAHVDQITYASFLEWIGPHPNTSHPVYMGVTVRPLIGEDNPMVKPLYRSNA